MSSIKQRRNSPRPRPPGPEWSIGVFLAGFVLFCGIATAFVGLAVDAAMHSEPRPCARIGNVIVIAGDCR